MKHVVFGSLLLALVMFWPAQTPAKDAKKDVKVEVKPVPASDYKRFEGKTIVYVANGIGGSTMVSDNLREAGFPGPVCLETVHWCKRDAWLHDYADADAQLGAGGKLAATIGAMRHEAPNCRIVLVGQSAGTRVVLAAAEAAPKDSINRIMLLSATVSCTYDLSPALKASRGGIDAFFSPDDNTLDTAEDTLGTSDGLRGVATAGKVGFRMRKREDYRRVRQTMWRGGLGGNGGHFSYARVRSLRRIVVPLVFTDVAGP